MNKEELEQKIKRYRDINAQMKVLMSEKDVLAEEVTKKMIDDNISEIMVGEGDDAIIAKYGSKTTFKYLNEADMIKYLSENKGEKYIETSIITRSLNNALKKPGNEKLVEALSPYYQKNTSYSLSVMLKSDYDKHIKEKE